MTPGRRAPGVFCLQFSGHPFALLGGLQDWRGIASHVDCYFRCCGHAGALRPARPRADSCSKHFSVWHVAHKFDRLLFARPDRPVHFESHGHLARLARGYCRRLLWRLHHVLELRMGNGQDAGRWRVGARHSVCRGERRCRTVAKRSWYPAGKPAVRSGRTPPTPYQFV